MNTEKLFVVGAGFMGMGIVQNAAVKGFEVTVYDISEMSLERGQSNLEKHLAKDVAKGKISQENMDKFLKNVTYTTRLRDCKDADYIIEAIVENEKLKVDTFKMIDNFAKEDAILASNTSSISITTLASHIEDPTRFIGMHFFSPVPKMALMEVVKGLQTSQKTIEKATKFGKKLGKKCILSQDEPGFIINRMLLPMLNEACLLLERGVGSIEEIDLGARTGLNHPMGPFELVDMIGLDVELAVMEVLHTVIGDQKYRPALLLRKMVDAGYLGRKAGKGFYIYDADGNKTPNNRLLS